MAESLATDGSFSPRTFLAWNSGARAQTSALRLLAFGTSIVPNEANVTMLIGQEIQSELIELGYHARRGLEMSTISDIAISASSAWPRCTIDRCLKSLSEGADALVHSAELRAVWGPVDGEESPYRNRGIVFASHAEFQTDGRNGSIYIAPLAAAVLCTVNKKIAAANAAIGES